MRHRQRLLSVLYGCVIAVALTAQSALAKDVPYVPTPEDVVAEMLQLAQLDKNDVLYDLGSGDGRIVITAAKKYGVRGVGVDIDPERIAEAKENAKEAGVTDRVRFIEGDLFEVDLRDATAVTLYLLSTVNLKLRPKLLTELKPGTPIVSHAFDMDDWEPDQVVDVSGSTVYLWRVPANASGRWSSNVAGRAGEETVALNLDQQFQRINGTVTIDGKQMPVQNGRVQGEEISFAVMRDVDGQRVAQRFNGRVKGDRIEGVAEVQDGDATGKHDWRAQRQTRSASIAK